MSLQTFRISTGAVTLAAAASSTGQATITFPTLGDFICHQITGVALQAGIAIPTFGGSVRISFNDGKMAWMTVAAVPFLSVVGDGTRPVDILPETRIPQGSTMVVDFVNSTAGVATVCYLTFIGNLEVA